MRKIWRSSNTRSTLRVERARRLEVVPNGFSITIRASAPLALLQPGGAEARDDRRRRSSGAVDR